MTRFGKESWKVHINLGNTIGWEISIVCSLVCYLLQFARVLLMLHKQSYGKLEKEIQRYYCSSLTYCYNHTEVTTLYK